MQIWKKTPKCPYIAISFLLLVPTDGSPLFFKPMFFAAALKFWSILLKFILVRNIHFLFQADSLAAACSLHVDSVPPTGRSPHLSSSPIVFHIIIRIDFLLLHNFSFCRRIVSRLRFFTSVTLLTFICQVPLQIPFDKAWHPGKNSNPPKFPRTLTHYLSSPLPRPRSFDLWMFRGQQTPQNWSVVSFVIRIKVVLETSIMFVDVIHILTSIMLVIVIHKLTAQFQVKELQGTVKELGTAIQR